MKGLRRPGSDDERWARSGTHLPLVPVAPDAEGLALGRSARLDLGRVKERQARLGRDHLELDVRVLRGAGGDRLGVSLVSRAQDDGADRGEGPTSSRAAAISGALMDATLPVVMSRTWTAPCTRAEAETNCWVGGEEDMAEEGWWWVRAGQEERHDGGRPRRETGKRSSPCLVDKQQASRQPATLRE